MPQIKNIVLAALAVTVVILLFARQCQPNRQTVERVDYEHQIEDLKKSEERKKAELQQSHQQFERLVKKHMDDSVSSARIQLKQSTENRTLKKRIESLQAEVQPLIDSIPLLASYDSAKNALIANQQGQIDTLKNRLAMEQQISADLINNTAITARVNESIRQDLNKRATLAEQRVEKLERKIKRQPFKIGAAIVITGVIVWLADRF